MPLTNAGAVALASYFCGDGAIQALDAGHSYIGVGDSAAAFALSQVDLQASTNKLRKLVSSVSYTAGNAYADYTVTFDLNEANWAWNEVGLFNAAASGTMLTRTVLGSFGTKPNTESWTFVITVFVPGSTSGYFTDAAANVLTSLIVGSAAAAAFDLSHGYIGVGDSAAVFDRAQTDLQSPTNRERKAIAAPQRSANSLLYSATFGRAEGIYDWREVGLFNSPSGGAMASRVLVNFGVKKFDDIWTIVLALQCTTST